MLTIKESPKRKTLQIVPSANELMVSSLYCGEHPPSRETSPGTLFTIVNIVHHGYFLPVLRLEPHAA